MIKMTKRKILILGGAGFIGQNLAKYLREGNYDVFCFDRKPVFQEAGIRYIEGDFFNTQDLKNAIKGMNCVIHMISTINPGNSNEMWMSGYQNDFLQTVNLCSMLLEENIKLIFISSGGTVYGEHNSALPLSENSHTEPINHYGNIKLCIENVMRTFNHQMGARFLIARVSNPYGPGQDFHKGVGFIDAVLKNTMKHLPVEIWGNGEIIRDYVYIDDVCEMIECLINYEGKINTFNVCSGVGTSQNQIVDIVKKMGYQPQIIYKEKRKVDVEKIILDNHRIFSLWKQKPMDIVDGLKKYNDYLKIAYKIKNEK